MSYKTLGCCRGFAFWGPRKLESDQKLRASSLEAHSQLGLEIGCFWDARGAFQAESIKLPSVLDTEDHKL